MRTKRALSNTLSDCAETSRARQRRFGRTFSVTLMTSVGFCLSVGCASEVDSNPDQSELELSGKALRSDPGLASAGPTVGTASTGGATLALRSIASGYLLYRKSIVAPWCAAVLIDPSTALTAAHCVGEEVTRASLSVGFGAVGEGPTYAISAIQVHPLYQPEQLAVHDIARLTLTEPVRDVPSMTLATQFAAEEKVSIVSYAFVRAGDKSDRRVFDGTAYSAPDAGLSAVFAGADTNCQGESGAGLLRLGGDSSSPELLGIASSASHDPPHPFYPTCLGRIIFAPVADNLDFIAPQPGG